MLLEDEAHQSGDHERLIHLLGEFHIKLARSLNNPVLLDWFQKLISRASLYAAALDDDSHEACRDDEHLRLIEYIEAGNQSAAIELTCMHLNGIEKAILDVAATLKSSYNPLKHLIEV